MTHSPEKILHFLATHFEALSVLYGFAKDQHRAITAEQFGQFTTTHGLAKQLLDYKILQPDNQEGYYLAPHYWDFFTFLHRDFSLEMPEQLGKYSNSFKKLRQRLEGLSPDKVSDVSRIVENLIQEIHRFLALLADSTTALEDAADQLRAKQAEKQDHAARIAKASYLIDTYLDPLNQILATHPDSIAAALKYLRRYAHQQGLAFPDAYRGRSYRTLHTNLTFAEKELNTHLDIVVRKLMPLVEQIRKRDRILAGFKNLRDAHTSRSYDRYISLLPKLVRKRAQHVYSLYWESSAQGILSEVGQTKPIIIYKEHKHHQVPQVWILHASQYKAAIYAALPIEHFYNWCKKVLVDNNPDTPICARQFFKVADLLFDANLKIDFVGKRCHITLQDAILDVPQIDVSKKRL